MAISSVFEDKEFEERSDYIDLSDLGVWNVSNGHFDSIQRNLLNTGIKLLSGPRGTGKTHQMKIAHYSCISDTNKPLSILVSFSKYYYLEPFLAKVPNAIQIFQTWVLCKIVLSCYNLVEETESEYDIFNEDDKNKLNKYFIQSFVDKAEKLKANQLNDDPLLKLITITKVIKIIEDMTLFFNRKRAVLMLDDAALTLTPEYLIEFFDVVRSLKTRIVSPKVSVYPGSTQYGPRFHIGHDAELIQCWLSIEDSTYSDFMNSLIEKRFLQYTEGINQDVIEIFKYASFGVPRAFISLLRNFKASNKRNILQNFNTVIEQQSKFIESEYLSIAQKLVQYKSVIETGYTLFKKMAEDIRSKNVSLVNEKNITVGISIESMQQYKLSGRMIRFLIEAGLLYEETSVKFGTQETGEKREYKRFILHVLFLIQNRSFSKNPTVSFGEISSRIKLKPSRHSLRRALNKLLNAQELNGLNLDLPPCQNCGNPRLSVEQRYCHNCGRELVNQSVFEECLRVSVDDLQLTGWQKKILKENSLYTIGDFLSLQDPGNTLKAIHRIGSFKANKIYKEVNRAVDEFFSI